MNKWPGRRAAEDGARAGLAVSLVAYATAERPADLVGPTRGRSSAAFARQIAMYLSHVSFGMSLARVASAFARDRSTVAHACQIVEDRRDDPTFDAWLETLEDAARAAPPPRIPDDAAPILPEVDR
ncbi:chromosomal replication initiator DnaA [bacterium]|nr:chromosomal replication initiator DnaA [bacterium]